MWPQIRAVLIIGISLPVILTFSVVVREGAKGNIPAAIAGLAFWAAMMFYVYLNRNA